MKKAKALCKNILLALLFAIVATGLAMAATWDPMAYPKQANKITHHTDSATLNINKLIPGTVNDNVGAAKNITLSLPACTSAHEGAGTTFLQTSTTYTIILDPPGSTAIPALGTDNQTVTIPAIKGNRASIRCLNTDWWIVDHNGTLTAQ